MTSFDPPEPPPPEVAEHLRHMTDGHWHDNCRFCRRRAVKGGNGVLPEDYLPPISIGQLQDLMVEIRQVLAVQPETPIIEGEAWDDGPLPPPSGPCAYDGMHCWHWSYTTDPCCHCGSPIDSDDSRCHGRLR